MKPIDKYNTYEDYLRSKEYAMDKCRVSQIGPSGQVDVRYDVPSGVAQNRVFTAAQLRRYDVCAVVKDLSDGRIKYIPAQLFSPSNLDTTVYEIKPWVRFMGYGQKQIMVYKSPAPEITVAGGTTKMWSVPQYIKFTPVLSSPGSCSVTAKINDSNKTGTVSWSAGASASSVASQFTTILGGSGNNPNRNGGGAWAAATGNYVKIAIGSYTNFDTAIEVLTGSAIVEDLSSYMKYGSLEISSGTDFHRHGWQNQRLEDILPAEALSDLEYAYRVGTGGSMVDRYVFCRHGENLGNRVCMNYSRYYSAFSTGGINSDTYPFTMDVPPMKETVFNNWSDAGLFGTYENYLISRMVDLDSKKGIVGLSSNCGNDVNSVLSRIETKDFSGEWVPAFPAAAMAASIVDEDLCPEGASLPTALWLSVLMSDRSPDTITQVNSVLSNLTGGQTVSNTVEYQTSAEVSISMRMAYGSDYGCMMRTYKNKDIAVLPMTAYTGR